MHTVMPTNCPERSFPQTLGRSTERQVFRLFFLLFLVICPCGSQVRGGCTHAQPAGWYSHLRSDLPETMKAADNTRWNGLFEVVYENGEFVYVVGASDNHSHLPRCGRDAEESLRQLALHFGASRGSFSPASQSLAPNRFQRPNFRYPSELSLGHLLDGYLLLPEHPPRS
jgi:hypothetical protein